MRSVGHSATRLAVARRRCTSGGTARLRSAKPGRCRCRRSRYEHVYFFNLASSHLYEAAETFWKAHREWPQVRDFVAALDHEHQTDFTRVSALASPSAVWPAERLKTLRNSFFHYLRLDRGAADAERLPLVEGLRGIDDEHGRVVIEAGGVLTGIRSIFADDVLVNTIAADYDDGELDRLVAALPDYQAALNRFAQAALGRYLRSLPDGVVDDRTP
jgi:hypothetical protein